MIERRKMSNGLKNLNAVHLSRLSPVMWSLKGGYPRRELSVPIEPLDVSMGNDDGRYAWNRHNSVANLRPISFGTDAEIATVPQVQTAVDAEAERKKGFWFPFLLAAGGAAVLYLLATPATSV